MTSSVLGLYCLYILSALRLVLNRQPALRSAWVLRQLFPAGSTEDPLCLAWGVGTWVL